MTSSAISLVAVSKKYHLYESLKHRIYEALYPRKKKFHREFWALRDVSLEIPRGTTVGILGINGSGKSTLLQIVCSILQPSAGQVKVDGRIAALLELGAGFNPELTGRENAEINCVIMGLDARAARERLPGIEVFADIGDFFDQPVKTYSSGMFMRVAFATAISVDPDILVIDEALAVGDAKFQQKCFRKFRDFQSAGKTILLVTHDRSTVPRLCTHGLLLDHGRMVYFGEPKEATDLYSRLLTQGEIAEPHSKQDEVAAEAAPNHDPAQSLKAGPTDARQALDQFIGSSAVGDRCALNPTYNKNEFVYGVGGASIIDYLLHTGEHSNPTDMRCGDYLDLYVKVRYTSAVEHPVVGIAIKSREGGLIYGVHSGWLGVRAAAAKPGDVRIYKFSVRMDLAADDWFIDLAVASSQAEVLHTREGVVHIRTMADSMSIGVATLKTSVTELTTEATPSGVVRKAAG